MLVECKIGKDLGQLQFRAVSNIYILNKDTTKEVHLTVNDAVAGFGKGDFKMLKQEQALDDTMIPYFLKDSNTQVCFNGSLTTLGHLVSEMRETKPDVTVCYHKLEMNESNPMEFTCVQTHKLVYIAASQQADTVAHSNIGCKLPAKVRWGESKMAAS